MPIDFRCPHCSNPMKLPERLAGKKLRCTGCSQVFVAPAPSAEAEFEPTERESRPHPAAPSDPLAEMFGDDDAPARGGTSRPEDTDDDRPRRRRRRDEDDDLDRPRRRRRRDDDDFEMQRRPPTSNMMPLLIGGGIGLAVLLVAIVVLIVVFVGGGSSQVAVLNAAGTYQDSGVIRLGNRQRIQHDEFLGRTYAVDLQAGRRYDITLASREFDAYLFLLDPGGTVVAQNDDAPFGGLNSLIVFQPPRNGRYRVFVTSLGGTKTGSYHFAISRR